MPTKIGLIADVHGAAAPLREALNICKKEGVSPVLCVGDIAGYGTEIEESIVLLQDHECITLLGNHEQWYLDRIAKKQENSLSTYFSSLPRSWESLVEGVRLYAVHGSPTESVDVGIKLLDEAGQVMAGAKKKWAENLAGYDFDILIVGHTHQVFAEILGDKLVINPGSTQFNHSFAILSLPDREVRILSLSGKEHLKTWNWGMMVQD